MTNDELQQLVESNAQAINLIVTELVPAIRLDAERTKTLTERSDTRSAENELRFNNLLAEARTDREEWRSEFKKWQENFDRQLAELKALNERVTNLEQAS